MEFWIFVPEGCSLKSPPPVLLPDHDCSLRLGRLTLGAEFVLTRAACLRSAKALASVPHGFLA